ncbi:MAG: hypothetical protein ACOYM9_10540 [Bradymonadia bacterium]|jgi:hypothetical protein
MKPALVLAALASICLSTQATAGPKSVKPAATPVEATFSNRCAEPLSLTLGAHTLSVAPGASTPLTFTPDKPGEALPLSLVGASTTEIARLAFAQGGAWSVDLSGCAAGKADVSAVAQVAAPTGSPLAQGQVHFRARSRDVIEIQVGLDKLFKRLSVAMTSYQEVPAGDLVVQVRKKAAAAGPVVGLEKRTFKVLPGRNQLIELDFGGATVHTVFEDEGPVKAK